MKLRRSAALGIAGFLAAAGTLTVVSTAAEAAPDCAKILSKAARAADVAKASPAAFKAAEKRNAGKVDLKRADKSLWLDRCGDAYYVDAGPSATERADAEATMGFVASVDAAPLGGVPLDQTFTLESRPGSSKTIYLDFKGGSFSGTAWNQSYGTPIVAEPYSIDSTVDTNFSAAELTEIQKTWQVVAEDYAPFDVNVTLKDPGAAAIDRTSSSDLNYGTRALITNGGVVYNGCGCGGVAYVGVFNTSGSNHMYYQPAWVFSNGTTKNGKYIGEATSHEVGHNFGLNHDAVNGSGYYSGSSPWAPIMGASYSQPVSQWSKGEYPGGSNFEDDVAKISTGAAYLADEDTGGALALGNGDAVNGIVGRSTDTDTYSFTAAGTTTVAVNVTAFPDLDSQLTIRDSGGGVVAVVNPTTTRVSAYLASGMNATYTFEAPAGGAAYTAVVQGAGQGTVPNAGAYSTYGSLGNYQITLSTSPGGPQPLGVSVGAMSTGTVGTAYSSSPVTASGGTAPYGYSATGLPGGLSINAGTGAVTGTPTTAGSFTPTFTVTDSAGGSVSQSGAVTINPRPALALTVAAMPVGTVGTAYGNNPLSASGGTAPYSFSATGLPAGLSINASTGAVTGTPTAAGSYAPNFTVTDSAGGSVTRAGAVTINPPAPPPLTIPTAATLPAGKARTAYSTTLSVTGGTPGYTWARISGNLPSGLVLTGNGATATISGTPTKQGNSTFTLRVTDAAGATVSKVFTLKINK